MSYFLCRISHFSIWIISICCIVACASNERKETVNSIKSQSQNGLKAQISLIDSSAHTLATRIHVPENFERVLVKGGSFPAFLRNLSLQKHGAKVRYYDGRTKLNPNIYIAVLDQNISDKDLHQCADAIIRLKAEYHWERKEYAKIQFELTNGFSVPYRQWMNGYRITFQGNETKWIKTHPPSNTDQDFQDYLEFLYIYAGTLSLSKELSKIEFEDMEIGDVLLMGGSPGHAVLVLDMAQEIGTNKKIFLLGQSYMPAQQFQILVNPTNPEISPWYAVPHSEKIETPEWSFTKDHLKRFPR